MLARERLEAGAHIGHLTRQDALDGHQLEGDVQILRGDDVAGGDDAGRGLDRGDAAAMRRVAQRAADVIAQAERAHPRGDRGGLAAARAAGGARRIPRVQGAPVELRVGVHP